MKRVTVIFRVEDHMQLKLHSVQTGKTMNDLIVTAVHLYMQSVNDSGKGTQDVP